MRLSRRDARLRMEDSWELNTGSTAHCSALFCAEAAIRPNCSAIATTLFSKACSDSLLALRFPLLDFEFLGFPFAIRAPCALRSAPVTRLMSRQCTGNAVLKTQQDPRRNIDHRGKLPPCANTF